MKHTIKIFRNALGISIFLALMIMGVALAGIGDVNAVDNGEINEKGGADVSPDCFEATPNRDYGDLPNSGTPDYGDNIVNAYHIPQGIRLGQNVDVEISVQSGAASDDSTGADDEDGVARDPTDFWTNGASVDLFVTTNGCSTDCRLNGWIDWNMDGDFADPNEQIFNDVTIANSSPPTRTITIPGSSQYTVGTDVYARFRICETADLCNTVTAAGVSDGEIEDYLWSLGPTSVTVLSLSATSYPSTPTWLMRTIMIFVVAAGTLVIILLLRSRMVRWNPSQV